MEPSGTTNQALLYEEQSEELIDTSFDWLGASSANILDIPDVSASALVSGVGLHLVPSSRKVRKNDGTTTGEV